MVIPTMYSIAKGDRDYIGEAYTKLRHQGTSNFDFKRQVYCSTIPHQRDVMPILFELITPNLYGVQLYPNRILSPFHRSNRYFYKYRVITTRRYMPSSVPSSQQQYPVD